MTRRRLAILGGAGVAALLVGIVAFASRGRDHHEVDAARWTALVHVERCLREAMKPAAVPEPTCQGDIDTLRAMPAFDVVNDWTARDRVLSVIDHELHRYVLQYEDREGRDAIYWQLQLGYLMQVASDDQLRGDTAKVAIDMADLDAAMKAAPLEIRRSTRGFHPSPGYTNSVLEKLTGPGSVVPAP